MISNSSVKRLGNNAIVHTTVFGARMAIDAYLQIDGIKGESADEAHQGGRTHIGAMGCKATQERNGIDRGRSYCRAV
jgi:hypothetical protein